MTKNSASPAFALLPRSPFESVCPLAKQWAFGVCHSDFFRHWSLVIFSFHSPFVDAGGEAFGELDLQAQRVGFHGLEGGSVVFVGFAAETGRLVDRLPFVVVTVK